MDEKVAKDVQALRETFESGKTLSASWRRKQLLDIQKMVTEGQEVLCSALKEDLNKSMLEGFVAEVSFIQNEVQEHLDHLDDWMAPESVPTDLLNIPGTSEIQRDPLGVACVMGAWNYPVQLSLLPVVGAIAAGNTVLVRVPSDKYSTHASRAMATLLEQYMDPSVVRCVEGARDATTAVLRQRFDIIFFTGGSYVGKMVAKAAAEYLTPVVLELGGKSPCIIDSSADLTVAARRVTWGAFMNAGQTCVRPDYVMVHESVAEKFIAKVKDCIVQMYGRNAMESDYFGRIINSRAHQRLTKILQDNKEFISYGGKADEDNKFIEPTILDFGRDFKAFATSSSMADEIFGPIMPIFRYSDISSVIHFINNGGKPLALYCFTTDHRIRNRILRQTSSGGAVVNDCIVHLSNSNLPFGGVGQSGMGSYHGKASFDVFSHKKSVLHKTTWFDLPQRYPPYSPMSGAILKAVLAPRPRWQGRTVKLILWLFLVFVARSNFTRIKQSVLEIMMKFM